MTGVSIVIPAYDEVPNLRLLIPRIRGELDDLGVVGVEVIVAVRVDTPAADDEELRGLGATVVHRQPTDSFGDAIRSGLAAVSTSSTYVVTMDADGSHDPARLPDLLRVAESAHVVVASRYVRGGRSDNTLPLRVMSKALNRAYSTVLGIDCRDVSTNYKVFRREDVASVTLTCHAFDVVEELLFRVAQIHGPALRIVEVPDHFHERVAGETKRRLGPFVVAYLVTLARLRAESNRR